MATIKDVFVIMALSVASFGIMLTFVSQVALDNNAIVDPDLNESFSKLQTESENFDNIRKSMENLSNAAQEADVGDFAYFGIKGMVELMKAPFKLITSVTSAVGIMGDVFIAYIPLEIINVVTTVLLIIVVFSAIKFLTSRGQEP